MLGVRRERTSRIAGQTLESQRPRGHCIPRISRWAAETRRRRLGRGAGGRVTINKKKRLFQGCRPQGWERAPLRREEAQSGLGSRAWRGLKLLTRTVRTVGLRWRSVAG